MTSSQIADDGENWTGFSACAFWLREIAYQLAVANEYKQLELQRQSEVLNS